MIGCVGEEGSAGVMGGCCDSEVAVESSICPLILAEDSAVLCEVGSSETSGTVAIGHSETTIGRIAFPAVNLRARDSARAFDLGNPTRGGGTMINGPSDSASGSDTGLTMATALIGNGQVEGCWKEPLSEVKC